MKISFLIFMACILCATKINGQTKTAASQQPQYLNNVYLLKQDSLILVEKVQAEMKNKAKALGFGGSEAGYFIDGVKSPFRIKLNDAMQFMVKLNSSMMDPTMMIKLYRFESGKSDREAILGGGGGMFNKKKDVGSNVEVPCNIQKSGSDVFIITPGTKLVPGEYGFLNMMLMTANGSKPKYTVFAFGVDQ
jgi:hypothetical protein